MLSSVDTVQVLSSRSDCRLPPPRLSNGYNSNTTRMSTRSLGLQNEDPILPEETAQFQCAPPEWKRTWKPPHAEGQGISTQPSQISGRAPGHPAATKTWAFIYLYVRSIVATAPTGSGGRRCAFAKRAGRLEGMGMGTGQWIICMLDSNGSPSDLSYVHQSSKCAYSDPWLTHDPGLVKPVPNAQAKSPIPIITRARVV